MSFEVGDIVRLKSESPPLTVSRLRRVRNDHDVIEVEWFKDGVLMRDAFDARCLVPETAPLIWPGSPGELVWINPNGDWAS